MAGKWHKNGIENADDRGNEICYTYIVYKWVLKNLLVFLLFRREFDTMKYCPYCGGELLNSQASFCVECGKSLSAEMQDVSAKHEKSQKHNEYRGKHMKKIRVTGRNEEQSVPVTSEKAKADDYDGYYDDVRPLDEGSGREEIDKNMIKKILLLVAGVLFIAGACVALMYLL